MKIVYSHYKIFGGFGLLLFLNGLIGFGLFKLLTASKISIDKVDLLNDSDALYAYSVIFGIQFLFLLLFITQNRFIKANRDGITFINPIFPFIRKTTKWTDFDYYLEIEEHSQHTTHDAIWLIKNSRLAGRFSSFYYSNYEDLVDQIGTRGKIGYFNSFKQLLILLGLRKIRDHEIKEVKGQNIFS